MNKPNLQVRRIGLDQIDFDDRTYCLRPEDHDELPSDFLGSLQRCGIIHPPIIQALDNSRFLIVAGRRRLMAARDILGDTSCNCLIMRADSTTLDGFKMVLEEGLLGPPWSSIMKAKFLKQVVSLIGREKTSSTFLPLLGIAPQPYNFEKLLSLTELEPPLSLAIHQGQIAEKTAYDLSRLPFRDRLALFDLITTLKLSVGNQRQIVSICNELAKRAASSVHSILNTQSIIEILKSKDSNPPQQAARLMKVLQSLRSPRLNSANQDFTDLQKRLNLPKWAEISHSPAFERDQVSLHLNFADQEKLEEFCRRFMKEEPAG